MALDFVAGCVGGCAGVFVGHPLDTVKVHLQTQSAKNKLRSLQCLEGIFKQQGVKGIYRGVTSPLLGIAGINAIVFGVYGNTQRFLLNPDSLYSHAISGASAGLIQCLITSPMELIKTKMQLGNATFNTPMEGLRSIFRNEGIRGIFRGFNITALRDVPAFSIYFVTYEFVTKRNNNNNNNLPISTFLMLMGGGIAGIASWSITYPIDVLKSRFQMDKNYSSSYDCLKKSVKSEGIVFLTRGLSPTLFRAFPVNAVTFTVVTWTMQLMNEFKVRIQNTEVVLSYYVLDKIHNCSVEQPFIEIL